MKINKLCICLVLLSSSKIFADNRAEAERHINRAKQLIGSIKNYKGHEKNLYNITNNRPAGKPGTITAYQTQKQKDITKKIHDAGSKVKEELREARIYADNEQSNEIFHIINTLKDSPDFQEFLGVP